MMHEMFKHAKAVREEVKEKVKDQDWGIASAVDDIRTKVVEEGYWLRPEGRAVTDDIQPSTMHSFYSSHLEAENERNELIPENEREQQETQHEIER